MNAGQSILFVLNLEWMCSIVPYRFVSALTFEKIEILTGYGYSFHRVRVSRISVHQKRTHISPNSTSTSLIWDALSSGGLLLPFVSRVANNIQNHVCCAPSAAAIILRMWKIVPILRKHNHFSPEIPSMNSSSFNSLFSVLFWTAVLTFFIQTRIQLSILRKCQKVELRTTRLAYVWVCVRERKRTSVVEITTNYTTQLLWISAATGSIRRFAKRGLFWKI